MSTRENSVQIKLNGDQLKTVKHFNYLESVNDKDGTIGIEVDLRVQPALSSWRKLTRRFLGYQAQVENIRGHNQGGSNVWERMLGDNCEQQEEDCHTEMIMHRGILGVSKRDHMRKEDI